jgi:thioester reductase-like protein
MSENWGLCKDCKWQIEPGPGAENTTMGQLRPTGEVLRDQTFMSTPSSILLTGATGLLGRYLLRDLAVAGHSLAVLTRDSHAARAAERVGEIVTFWSESLGQALPMPRVIVGKLGPGADVSLADRYWLRENCRMIVHAAASLSFRPCPDGEPWRTNFDGTAALLGLARELGIAEWHHVSTAYVCGRRRGTIREEDLDCGQDFHTPYEQSKLAAEKLLRGQSDVRVTTYRPAVIVGDSRTGYTSTYSGVYQFLEIGWRLAGILSPCEAGTRPPRQLPLRLPGTGDERCYLIPVDWVSAAITRLLSRPEWHGRTFHLLSPQPIPARLVQDTAAQELNISGTQWTGGAGLKNPTPIEQVFQEALEEHWPYLATTAEFDCANTLAALPDLPPPRVDRLLLQRLIGYAFANHWGQKRPKSRGKRSRVPSLPAMTDATPMSKEVLQLAQACHQSIDS